MDKRLIIEKVASGLRKMKHSPDFLLFLPQEDWTWEEEKICGIPVYHCSSVWVSFHPYSDKECPFIPCYFKEQAGDKSFDFARGYYEG